MENIFNTFNGMDLDRLALCIQAVRKAGLSINENAQAGINQGSGNVYIWSEDWAGSIYCSIGMDVSWLYSCGNCGEEFDFNTYAECQDFAEKCGDLNGHCTACAESETE